MRVPLSWHNTFQHRRRCVAAAVGVTFAVLLLFMQVGFLDAARINASLLYEGLAFDAVVVSRGYVSVQRTLTVDPFRMAQAARIQGVATASPLLVEGAAWYDASRNRTRSCRVVGVDPLDAPFLDPHLPGQLGRLRAGGTVLVDELSSSKYGPWETGGKVRINEETLTVVGTYAQGTGLISDGGVIVNQQTFARIIGRGPEQGYDVILLGFEPGVDTASTLESLRANLPADVLVLSRAEIIERERHFWVSLKPVGIMFKVGAAVAFVIGSVILYQVLAIEVGSRMREFATMRAMGFPHHDIYRVGVEQGAILALLGYVPAFLLALVLYRVVFEASRLPLFMAPGRAVFVLLLTLAMCAVGSVFALRRLRRADPAELF